MASSNYREIGEEIAAEIAQVEDVGQVHAYQRWADDMGLFLDLFLFETPGGDQVRGWIVTRESAKEEPASLGAREEEGGGGVFLPAGVGRRTHTFLIFGVMAVDDEAASELTFQDLVEAVCDRFRDNAVLRLRDAQGQPRVATLERLLPPQLDTVELRTFGSLLCHVAEVRIRAVERLART